MSVVLIAGGGAAGMAAAIAAAGNGHEVHIYERNEKPGKKLYITGKGRCNVTNAGGMESLMRNVVTNPRFLYSSFSGFSNRDMMDLLERNGCRLKVERGERVFPVSDKSSDVIGTLVRQMKELGVHLHLNSRVGGICVEDGRCVGLWLKRPEDGRGSGQTEARTGAAGGARRPGLKKDVVKAEENVPCTEPKNDVFRSDAAGDVFQAERETEDNVSVPAAGYIPGDAVIVATGGFSYQSTGSTGDGYRFAESCGHTVTELIPSLVPFNVKEPQIHDLQGLSLRNIEAVISDGQKELYREFGELLFTHFGVSGPVILGASSCVGKLLKNRPLTLDIDLKPALSREQLDMRILRDFQEASNKQFKNSLGGLYPAKLIPVMIQRSGIAPDKPVRDITKAERARLADVTKRLRWTLTGLRGFQEAIITKGGVSVKEVSPSTMESKKVKGLYFAGEVLDLDAMTGGFNLQIAWSTGWAAGSHIPW